MTTSNQAFITAERERVQLEYQRRAQASSEQYEPWQPSWRFIQDGRNRTAATMLQRLGVFPKPGDRCLEVGCGSLGWLSELITWGISESDLHGVELDSSRAARGRKLLPAADIRVGDAVQLPWPDKSFELVVQSMLFSSVLDQNIRKMIASEMVRVLRPGGALLWYDFTYNPTNDQVRGIGRREIQQLFPGLKSHVRSVTLAPPISRLITPYSLTLATLLEAIPFLRTHLMAVLIKG